MMARRAFQFRWLAKECICSFSGVNISQRKLEYSPALTVLNKEQTSKKKRFQHILILFQLQLLINFFWLKQRNS